MFSERLKKTKNDSNGKLLQLNISKNKDQKSLPKGPASHCSSKVKFVWKFQFFKDCGSWDI